jgi:hypothetical protein
MVLHRPGTGAILPDAHFGRVPQVFIHDGKRQVQWQIDETNRGVPTDHMAAFEVRASSGCTMRL